MKNNFVIEHYHGGCLSYVEGLNLQLRLHDRVKKDPSHGFILTLEHEPVITLGKNSSHDNFLQAREMYQYINIDIVQTERGGEVTAHEPGQLVIYPILPLQVLSLTVYNYISILQEQMLRLLGRYSIIASVNEDYPGLWVGNEKICALGIRVRDRVSMHGLALNVFNDFKTFSYIVPCGLAGKGITSMENMLGKGILTDSILEISKSYCQYLCYGLDAEYRYTEIQSIDDLLMRGRR